MTQPSGYAKKSAVIGGFDPSSSLKTDRLTRPTNRRLHCIISCPQKRWSCKESTTLNLRCPNGFGSIYSTLLNYKVSTCPQGKIWINVLSVCWLKGHSLIFWNGSIMTPESQQAWTFDSIFPSAGGSVVLPAALNNKHFLLTPFHRNQFNKSDANLRCSIWTKLHCPPS